MPRALSIAFGLIVIVAFVGLLLWLLVRGIRRSEDPARILVKTIASFIIAGLGAWAIFAKTGFSLGGSFVDLFIVLTIGLIGTVLWGPHIGALFAKPLTGLFDGGNQEIEPQPLYSMAIAKKKTGKFQEAVHAVQKELEKFPNDVEGQFLLAEIQAEGLNDLQAAALTIQRFCNQPGHAPENVALALCQLADWQLKYARDKQAARQALEQIIAMLPASKQAQMAEQRLARLGSNDAIFDAHDGKPIPFQVGVQNVGLMKDSSVLRRPEQDPAEKAAEYVKHLEEFPLDAEVREELAMLYAKHYQRYDLAIEQLEQLIQHPSQPDKQVVRWLNLVADFQIKAGRDYESIKLTLQRIVDLYPERSVADNARQRMDRIKLELKGQETGETLILGTYEQNLGLKKKSGQ